MSAMEVMIGNQAIALGLVEAGLEVAAAYPGTPSSEILPAVIAFKRRYKKEIHIEWSVNERVAMEVAFGAAMAGRKAACMMKQVGLNVAFTPFIKAKEVGIKGGLVIVSCDDPGPQSSQTEQDSRLIAMLFGFPVFDAASPEDARLLAAYALAYSVRARRPVVLRSTHRVSHARQAIRLDAPPEGGAIDEGVKMSGGKRLGVLSSGMGYNVAMDVLGELGLEKGVSLYKAAQIFPCRPDMLRFAESMECLLVLEETDEVLEALVAGRTKVLGRSTGHVPRQGELTYDVVRSIVQGVAEETGLKARRFSPDASIEAAVSQVPFSPRPPKLCAGCPHRASFYAMRQAFPKAVFPGDIGCYTLGTAQGAVDTCIDMGGSISLASGFFETFNQDGHDVPILASIGDSTFFHAALPLIYDAARTGKRFIAVILDNGTTAMTGMQPTPGSGMKAEGKSEYAVSIEETVAGLGVGFVRTIDPYDIPLMIKTLKEAQQHMKSTGRGPAAVIARHPCLLFAKADRKAYSDDLDLGATCNGCKRCVKLFDCPGIIFDEDAKKVKRDEGLCVNCGVCLFVCPQKKKDGRVRPGKGEAGIT
jgi:indolepyruvate ferredoxin oxidoreductase alpha subunit